MFLQFYLVPLTTGAAYRVAVKEESTQEGKAAAIRAAELAGASPAWDKPCALPRYAEEEEPPRLIVPAARPPAPAPIGHGEAAAIAAEWGSLVWNGDKGAIFYSFSGYAAPEWNRADRAAALAYCDSCLDIARANAAGELDSDSVCGGCGRDFSGAEEEEEETGPGQPCPVCIEDAASLETLRAYIVAGAAGDWGKA